MAALALVANMIAPGGGPASGCLLNSFIRNTTTRSPLYSNVGLSTPTTNPYVGDADGRLEFYFDSTIEYEWSVTTSDGATVIWEAEIIGGVVTVTYADGILIHSTWAPPLATALGSRWASAFGAPFPTFEPVLLADGSDESATIQAQLTAANTAGGGRVVINGPARTIRCKNLLIYSNTTLEIDDSVTLKLPDGSAVTDQILANANISSYLDTDIKVLGGTFDGNNSGAGLAQTRFTDLVGFGYVTGLTVKTKIKNVQYIGFAAGSNRNFDLDVDAENCGFDGSAATATVTIATPGVVTIANHGLSAGAGLRFTTTGALPTGITAGTIYYVIGTGLTANTFQFSASYGGAAVNTSGSQSGVHTVTTHSINGGPAVFVSRAGASYDQSEIGVVKVRARDCSWHGAQINGRRIKIDYESENTGECGLCIPHAPASGIIAEDIEIIYSRPSGVTQMDISASGYEIGGSNISFGLGGVENVDHSGIALLDAQGITFSGGFYVRQWNQDSRSTSPQGAAVAVFCNSASPAQAKNIDVTGLVLTDSAANSTVTITNASPAVITWASHGRSPGDMVQFTTSGALPTGLTVGAKYFVMYDGMTLNTFRVSATRGGAAVNTSSAGSGTHTCTKPATAYSAFSIAGSGDAATNVKFHDNNTTGATLAGTAVVTTKFGANCGAYDNAGITDEIFPTTIAGAATINLASVDNEYINVSGTSYTCTSLGTAGAGTKRQLRFTGTGGILTHNATSLILPTGANIAVIADDTAEFVSLGSGNWICTKPPGSIGKPLSSTVATGSAVSLVTATAKTVTSMTLTPGDWDVSWRCLFRFDTTTNITELLASISLTNNTLLLTTGAFNENMYGAAGLVPTNAGSIGNSVGPWRVNITTDTVVYGIAFATFTVSTAFAYGYLSARRVR